MIEYKLSRATSHLVIENVTVASIFAVAAAICYFLFKQLDVGRGISEDVSPISDMWRRKRRIFPFGALSAKMWGNRVTYTSISEKKHSNCFELPEDDAKSSPMKSKSAEEDPSSPCISAAIHNRVMETGSAQFARKRFNDRMALVGESVKPMARRAAQSENAVARRAARSENAVVQRAAQSESAVVDKEVKKSDLDEVEVVRVHPKSRGSRDRKPVSVAWKKNHRTGRPTTASKRASQPKSPTACLFPPTSIDQTQKLIKALCATSMERTETLNRPSKNSAKKSKSKCSLMTIREELENENMQSMLLIVV